MNTWIRWSQILFGKYEEDDIIVGLLFWALEILVVFILSVVYNSGKDNTCVSWLERKGLWTGIIIAICSLLLLYWHVSGSLT